ncbi:MAG: DUF561 domain-containing protein [Vampirovibrionales bacterium]|nr:DUF561 domain-containing protein [Vampirovibrionales bacterium]
MMHLTETTRATRLCLLRQLLAQHQLLKGIAGIAETRWEAIQAVVDAANESTHLMAIDIPADTKVVQATRSRTHLPIFASALSAQELLQAAMAGADALELGNYDALYEAGEFIDATTVLKETQELVFQLKRLGLFKRVLISITVPGHLAIDAQIDLAKALEVAGADVLQTEGALRSLSRVKATASLSASEKAAASLRAVRALSQAVAIPVMAASGFDSHNIAEAIAAGASAVGVGRAWRKSGNGHAMAKTVAVMISQMRQASGSQPVPATQHAVAC